MSTAALRPLSTEQHGAFTSGRLPELSEIREGVWALPMALPHRRGAGAIPFSYTYVLDDSSGGLHLIDPGWELEENLRALEDFLQMRGRTFSDIATATLTHMHPDHLGLADAVQRRSGATVLIGAREAEAITAALAAPDLARANRAVRTYTTADDARLQEWAVPRERRPELTGHMDLPTYPRLDRTVVGGDLLPIPGRSLAVLDTPGHTGGHISIRDADHRLVFTGDQLLPGINSGIGLGGPSPTDPVGDYYDSLTLLAGFEDYDVAPGHEFAFRGIAARAQAVAAHHGRRTREVEELLDGRDARVWEVASRVTWSDGFEALRGYRLGSALAQIAMHAEYVRERRGAP